MAEPTEHDEFEFTESGLLQLMSKEISTIGGDGVNDLFSISPSQPQIMYMQRSSGRSPNNHQGNLITMNLDFGPDIPVSKVPVLKVNVRSKIIRFRYKSELNNRKLGKEELVIIQLEGYEGEAEILLHTVDKDNKKAHPYMLVGDHCQNGMFIAKENFSSENNYECVCKATLLVPTRKEYEDGLRMRKKMADIKNITRPEMKKDDYWSANKNLKECKDFILFVEVRVVVNNLIHYLYAYSPILSNAKDGKNFEIYRISPFSAPCTGISSPANYPVVVLTKTSFAPNDNVEVHFEDINENWSVRSEHVNIIKNCIEFAVPPYKDESLDDPREVKIKLVDRQKDMETLPFPFMYEPTADQVQAKRRRKVPHFSVPEQVMKEAEKYKDTHLQEQEQRKPPLKPSIRKYLSKKNAAAGRPPQTSKDLAVQLLKSNCSPSLPHLLVKEEEQASCAATVSSTTMVQLQSGAVVSERNQASFKPQLVNPQLTSSHLVPSGHSMVVENPQNELLDIEHLIGGGDQGSLSSYSSSASGQSTISQPLLKEQEFDDVIKEICVVKEEPVHCTITGEEEEHNPERTAKVNEIINFLKDSGPDGAQKAANMMAGNFTPDISAILQQTDIITQNQPGFHLNGFQNSRFTDPNPTVSSPHHFTQTASNVYMHSQSLPQTSGTSNRQLNSIRGVNSSSMPTINQDFLGSHLMDVFDANDLEIDTYDDVDGYVGSQVPKSSEQKNLRISYKLPKADDLEIDGGSRIHNTEKCNNYTGIEKPALVKAHNVQTDSQVSQNTEKYVEDGSNDVKDTEDLEDKVQVKDNTKDVEDTTENLKVDVKDTTDNPVKNTTNNPKDIPEAKDISKVLQSTSRSLDKGAAKVISEVDKDTLENLDNKLIDKDIPKTIKDTSEDLEYTSDIVSDSSCDKETLQNGEDVFEVVKDTSNDRDTSGVGKDTLEAEKYERGKVSNIEKESEEKPKEKLHTEQSNNEQAKCNEENNRKKNADVCSDLEYSSPDNEPLVNKENCSSPNISSDNKDDLESGKICDSVGNWNMQTESVGDKLSKLKL